MKIVLALLCEFYARNGYGKFLYKNRKGAYAPTTLTTLASLIPDELNADVEIYDEFIERFDAHTIEADIVALSFTTPNANHAYEAADILRARGITVVLGGYHTSLMLDEATVHADACIVGYAEKSWPKLLRDFTANKLQNVYSEPPCEAYENLSVTRSDLLKKHKYFYSHSIEFSRNCVNNCRFCVISAVHPSKQIFRNIAVLKDDIKKLKAKNLVLLDSSPAENKEQFLKLCDTLKELNVKWHCNISLHSLENYAMIEKMADCGCKGVLLGFESINQNSLNAQNKAFNKVEKYKEIVREFHKHKMYVFGTFVFGFDNDDASVFDETFRFVNEAKIDIVNYSTLIPFPGTQIFKDLENQGRILTKNWSEYDGKHVVYKPLNMTEAELQKGLVKAYRETFTFRSIIKRTLLNNSASFINFFGNIALRTYNIKALVKNFKTDKCT